MHTLGGFLVGDGVRVTFGFGQVVLGRVVGVQGDWLRVRSQDVEVVLLPSNCELLKGDDTGDPPQCGCGP